MLLHILKPLGLIVLKYVPEKKSWKEVAAIFDEINAIARTKGFQIEKAFTDPEGNCIRAKGKTLLDIDTNGPRLHQEDAERCVRTVKERLRCLEIGSCFQVARRFVPCMCKCVAHGLNCVLKVGQTVTSKEAFEGIKLDLKIICRAEFGEYAAY